jgi:hypothetical protein
LRYNAYQDEYGTAVKFYVFDERAEKFTVFDSRVYAVNVSTRELREDLQDYYYRWMMPELVYDEQ